MCCLFQNLPFQIFPYYCWFSFPGVLPFVWVTHSYNWVLCWCLGSSARILDWCSRFVLARHCDPGLVPAGAFMQRAPSGKCGWLTLTGCYASRPLWVAPHTRTLGPLHFGSRRPIWLDPEHAPSVPFPWSVPVVTFRIRWQKLRTCPHGQAVVVERRAGPSCRLHLFSQWVGCLPRWQLTPETTQEGNLLWEANWKDCLVPRPGSPTVGEMWESLPHLGAHWGSSDGERTLAPHSEAGWCLGNRYFRP